jgi:hypothetical protein
VCLITALALTSHLARPAQAKAFSLERLVIRGPGLEVPITLSGDELWFQNRNRYPIHFALERLMWGSTSEDAPEGGLGLRYRLRYVLRVFPFGGDDIVPLIQDLYPYADGGPITHTPPSQSVRLPGSASPQVIPSGWQAFPEEVVEGVMHRHGLPPKAAAREILSANAPANLTATNEPARDQGSAGWILLALPTSVGAAGALLIAFHRRRRDVGAGR